MSEIDLRARCSKHFTWSDLIECGETWASLQREGEAVSNLPSRPETWEALGALARRLLDPLVDHFGAVRLTYGFAGPALTRRVPGRIAPSLDQHAGYEHNARGARVCPRGGQACDLCVPGVSSLVVGRWIREALPFDRMYLYGADRPLHVSDAIEPAGRVVAMRPGGRGRVPMDVTRRGLDEIEALFAARARR